MLTLIPYFGWLYNHLSGHSYISKYFWNFKFRKFKTLFKFVKVKFYPTATSMMHSMLEMSYCKPKNPIWRMINKIRTCVDSSCVSLHSSLVILVCVSALFEPLWGLKIKIERERSVWRLTVNQVREKIRIDISEYF